MRERVEKKPTSKFVPLNREDLIVLDEKRKKSAGVLEILNRSGIQSITYGSTCRGDAKKHSDIDIIVPYVLPSYKIEVALDGFHFEEKLITQATPNHAIKGIFTLDHETSVGFPLTPLRSREVEFYSFAGKLNLQELKEDLYVPGINKRLELVTMSPDKKGYHKESLVGKHLPSVAKQLDVNIATIEERVRVLNTRDEKGRKGVFLKHGIPSDSSFENELRKIADRKPPVKRFLARFS